MNLVTAHKSLIPFDIY